MFIRVFYGCIQSVVARLCGEQSSVVSDSEFIHEEIRQQQRRCICPSRFPVQKVDSGKYKVQHSFKSLLASLTEVLYALVLLVRQQAGLRLNKKLSYRRETARQLPTWREGARPSSPLPLRPLWLHLCVWSNPKATTYVRQACRPLSAL